MVSGTLLDTSLDQMAFLTVPGLQPTHVAYSAPGR